MHQPSFIPHLNPLPQPATPVNHIANTNTPAAQRRQTLFFPLPFSLYNTQSYTLYWVAVARLRSLDSNDLPVMSSG